MRVELHELLRTRTVSHPTRITAVTFLGMRLCIEVVGYSWWREGSHQSDEKITFVFESVGDGNLVLCNIRSWDDEALELFEVRDIEALEWNSARWVQVFCGSALPNPERLYAKVQNFLLDIQCPYRALDYLNSGNPSSLATFVHIAGADSYLLFEGPEAIAKVLLPELDHGQVRYKTIPHRRTVKQGILVLLDGSWFICESAYAEFDEKE